MVATPPVSAAPDSPCAAAETPFVHDSDRAIPRHSERTSQPSQTTLAGSADPRGWEERVRSHTPTGGSACQAGRPTSSARKASTLGVSGVINQRRRSPAPSRKVEAGCAPRRIPLVPLRSTVGSVHRMPQPGDRSPGFVAEASAPGCSCTTAISRHPLPRHADMDGPVVLTKGDKLVACVVLRRTPRGLTGCESSAAAIAPSEPVPFIVSGSNILVESVASQVLGIELGGRVVGTSVGRRGIFHACHQFDPAPHITNQRPASSRTRHFDCQLGPRHDDGGFRPQGRTRTH